MREYIARRADIPAEAMRVSTPLTPDFPRALAAAPATRSTRATSCARPNQYRLSIQANPTVPILDVYAQAPSAKAAEKLANAAVDGLRDYLDDVAATRASTVGQQAQLTQLGRAHGGRHQRRRRPAGARCSRS